MKRKIIWLTAAAPLLITAAVLQFMPDTVPMHYDISGNIDGWGSKYENLIFPVIILIIAAFWDMCIGQFRKAAESAEDDKQRSEALSNAKVLSITAVCTLAMFGIMQCFILCKSYVDSNSGIMFLDPDIEKISCFFTGILFILLGNVLTKTRNNEMIGLRISWSMYNDNTWVKSNRFAGGALAVSGLAVIVSTAFAGKIILTVLTLLYLAAATAASIVYARKVYNEELTKEQSAEKNHEE